MHKMHEIRRRVQRNRPLIHCITNPISINQCANGILAVGARPIMAEHPAEVREITESADALMMNLGNITDVRMQSMMISLQAAKEKGIPVILDAVGVSCSALRRDFADRLLEIGMPEIIKGNYSEIFSLHHAAHRSSGVDADASVDPGALCRAAAELAKNYRTVILASGKTDVVTDGSAMVLVRNGTPRLSSVTGTGCMLGALSGAYLSAGAGMDAAVTACTVLGLCGQMAGGAAGSGTFMTGLMDALSTLTETQLENGKNLEEMEYETL